MLAEKERSDYHVQDWWPTIKWYDWIPVVGLASNMERFRRESDESLAEGYLPWKFRMFQQDRKEVIKTPVSLGTHNWPEPTNKAASIRSNLMAARNMFFPLYHVLVPIYTYLSAPAIIRLFH